MIAFSYSSSMPTQNQIDFTPAHALSHRNGPATEREALAGLNVPDLENKTLGVISLAGTEGATLKDVCRVLNKKEHSISGRITWLEKKGYIKQTGEKRDRCRIFVTKDQHCDCGAAITDDEAEHQWGACYGCSQGIFE